MSHLGHAADRHGAGLHFHMSPVVRCSSQAWPSKLPGDPFSWPASLELHVDAEMVRCKVQHCHLEESHLLIRDICLGLCVDKHCMKALRFGRFV